MAMRMACKGYIAQFYGVVAFLCSPFVLFTTMLYQRWLLFKYMQQQLVKLSRMLLSATDMQLNRVLPADELDSPTTPVTRQTLAEYYTSRGRLLSESEINDFTRYACQFHESKTNSSRLKILPYIKGEYTNTLLQETFVANDDCAYNNPYKKDGLNIVRWAGVLKSSAKKRMSSLDCAAIVKGSTALGNAKAAGKVLDISAVQNAVAAKRAEKAAQLEDLMHQAESWQRTETEEEIDRKLKEIFQRIMTNDEYNTSPSAKETSSLARRGASVRQGIFSSDANAALPYSLLSGRSLDSSALRASERDDNNISALRASERDDSKNNKKSKRISKENMNTHNDGGYHA
jgi:hypothetical protein